MYSFPIVDPATGKVIGRACTRARRPPTKPCTFCQKPGNLLCDGPGCDVPLCAACAVGPSSDVDYCPRCFAPAWEHWKARCGGLELYQRSGRALARVRFRAWVRANPLEFLNLLRPRATP